MVDITRIDKITKSEKAAAKPAYSDFYNNFNIHPQNNRLSKYTNADSVKRSLRNLILTDKYERLFQPEVGSSVRSLLFEPITDITSIRLKDAIEDTITKHEPRVRLISTEVFANEARNSYDVYIVFEVINTVDPVSLNLTLFRAR